MEGYYTYFDFKIFYNIDSEGDSRLLRAKDKKIKETKIDGNELFR